MTERKIPLADAMRRAHRNTSSVQASPTEPFAVKRCSRLEFYRMLAVAVAEKLTATTSEQRSQLFIQLRAIQDEIANLKHRNPHCAGQASHSAWVDIWTPPE